MKEIKNHWFSVVSVSNRKLSSCSPVFGLICVLGSGVGFTGYLIPLLLRLGLAGINQIKGLSPKTCMILGMIPTSNLEVKYVPKPFIYSKVVTFLMIRKVCYWNKINRGIVKVMITKVAQMYKNVQKVL